MAEATNITRLLRRIAAGDTGAEADLFPLVYSEIASYGGPARTGHRAEPAFSAWPFQQGHSAISQRTGPVTALRAGDNLLLFFAAD